MPPTSPLATRLVANARMEQTRFAAMGPEDRARRIRAYLTFANVPTAKNWCASFISWIHAGAIEPGEAAIVTAGARDWGKRALAAGWDKVNGDLNHDHLLPGDVLIWQRGNPGSWTGHIGLVVKVDPSAPFAKRVTTIEGNVASAKKDGTKVVGFRKHPLDGGERLLLVVRAPG